MNWRRWAYDTIRLDDVISGIMPVTNIHAAGSLNSIPRVKPFVIINHAPSFRSNVRTQVGGLVISVHDDPGDYGRIDSILNRIRELFNDAIPGQPGSTVVEWLNDSTDLADDGYGTIMRQSSFRTVGGQP
jgi:hypothetical protein